MTSEGLIPTPYIVLLIALDTVVLFCSDSRDAVQDSECGEGSPPSSNSLLSASFNVLVDSLSRLFASPLRNEILPSGSIMIPVISSPLIESSLLSFHIDLFIKTYPSSCLAYSVPKISPRSADLALRVSGSFVLTVSAAIRFPQLFKTSMMSLVDM